MHNPSLFGPESHVSHLQRMKLLGARKGRGPFRAWDKTKSSPKGHVGSTAHCSGQRKGSACLPQARVLGRCKGRRHQRPEQHRGVIFTSPLLKACSASSLKEVQSAFKKSIEEKPCQGVLDPTFKFQ